METIVQSLHAMFKHFYHSDAIFRGLVDDLRDIAKDVAHCQHTNEQFLYFDSMHDYNLYIKSLCLNFKLMAKEKQPMIEVDDQSVLVVVSLFINMPAYTFEQSIENI